MDFANPADHRIKLEKRSISTSTLLGDWKNKLWNMKVTIIPIVICAFGTVTKDYFKDWRTWKLEDEWRPSKVQYYWERPEYWEESWRLEETCCPSNSSERPSANADVKNSQGVNSNNNNSRGVMVNVLKCDNSSSN